MDKTKVFVDLDDTLLDSAGIKKEMFEKITQLGVPEAEVRENYRAAREAFGGDYLKPFAESFQEFGIDGQILYPGLRQLVMQTSEKYLIEDRLLWLDRFPPDQYELYLLTYGNRDVQESKVQSLHLENLFEGRVIYVSGDKSEVIKQLLRPGEKFMIVDDKQKVLDEVIEKFPEQVEAFRAENKVDQGGSVEYDDPEGYYSPLDLHREGGKY